MTKAQLNDKARSIIKRSLATSNFTEKRDLLSKAVFALKPPGKARMVGAASFNSLIDRMLPMKGDALEAAVCEMASKVWT